MAMEVGGPRCAKYTLYVTNLLIIVLACVTLGVGIWMSSNISGFSTSMNPLVDPTGYGVAAVQATIKDGTGQIQTIANILITSGVFALLIGFLGIWAAYKDSKVLLITYATILIVIVLLEMGAGIAWSVDKPKITARLQYEYNSALPMYDYIDTTVSSDLRILPTRNQVLNNRTMPATALINMMQTMLGCCGGVNGYLDFRGSPYWQKTSRGYPNGVPPIYCCKLSNTRTLTLQDPSCAQVRDNVNSWMNVGCAEKVNSWINSNYGSIVGVAVGIGLINVLGIIAAFYQYHCLTQGYKEF